MDFFREISIPSGISAERAKFREEARRLQFQTRLKRQTTNIIEPSPLREHSKISDNSNGVQMFLIKKAQDPSLRDRASPCVVAFDGPAG